MAQRDYWENTMAYNHRKTIKPEVVEKALQPRKENELGPGQIKWYLERYRGMITSESSVYRILKKHKVERPSKRVSKRTVHSKGYSKLVHGHRSAPKNCP